MKKSTLFLVSVATLGVLGLAYWLLSPLLLTTERDDVRPVTTEAVIQQGVFQNAEHDVRGNVSIIETDEGHILRFENFETQNGPDLFVYLATDEKATDFVNLGAIQATKGNVNYAIPDYIDTTKYNHVIVWCRAFSINFGYATLQ